MQFLPDLCIERFEQERYSNFRVNENDVAIPCFYFVGIILENESWIKYFSQENKYSLRKIRRNDQNQRSREIYEEIDILYDDVINLFI